MSNVIKWVNEAAKSLEIDVERLPDEAVNLIDTELREIYADPKSELSMWESMKEHVSRRRADGWRDIGEFVGDSSCYLFAEQGGLCAYRIRTGSDLTNLLTECPGFEFYVSDGKDYILCHNHHDFLIGAGRCMEWMTGISDDSVDNACLTEDDTSN